MNNLQYHEQPSNILEQDLYLSESDSDEPTINCDINTTMKKYDNWEQMIRNKYGYVCEEKGISHGQTYSNWEEYTTNEYGYLTVKTTQQSSVIDLTSSDSKEEIISISSSTSTVCQDERDYQL